MKRDFLASGRQPAGICCAALTLATRVNRIERSKEEIRKVGLTMGGYCFGFGSIFRCPRVLSLAAHTYLLGVKMLGYLVSLCSLSTNVDAERRDQIRRERTRLWVCLAAATWRLQSTP